MIEIGYTINWAAAHGAAAMPKAAADCLGLSSGIAAKVFIYICANDGAAAEQIAEAIGTAAEDVTDALLFWERTGLLTRTGNSPAAVRSAGSGANFQNGGNISQNSSQSAGMISQSGAKPRKTPEKPSEIAAAAVKNSGISDVFRAAEKILARPLRFTETRVLTALSEENNIPPDILIMLIDFARSKDRYSAAYIDETARDWASRGIVTHAEAEAEILCLSEFFSLEGQVKTRFGLRQSFSKTQKKYVREWADKGFSIEDIMSAFDITVDRIGKADFKYITKVLEGEKTEGKPQKRQQKDDPSFSYGDFGEKTIERILRESEEVYS
ncbi:MAG: DnaD domain protein [Ruminococcus sp.]|nr:DnaD domain protein [Ruminococcus sp.]